MGKILYPIIFLCCSLIFVLAACGAPPTQITTTPEPETETPVPTASPTETATLTPLPTETEVPFTPTPEFAPICEPGVVSNPTPAGCQLPIAEQRDSFCTHKVPYNLIFMNEGATYDLLGEGIRCFDEGIRDGKKIVTCTGPIAEPFELIVCDSACAAPTTQAGTTQCPQGYIFNNAQGCCTQQLQPVNQSCTVLHLQTKRCLVDCGEFKSKATCENQGYACIWDDGAKECQPR